MVARNTLYRLALPWIVGGCLLTWGCTGSDPTKPKSGFQMTDGNQRPVPVTGRQSEHLARALNLVKSDDVAEWEVFENSVTDSLNTAWNVAKSSEELTSMAAAVPDWTPSPLLQTLPAAYQSGLSWQNFASETFLYTDAFYLQEQFWLNQIVTRVRQAGPGTRFGYLTHAGRPQPLSLVQALQANDANLSAEQAESLALALTLFDWTVRNVSGEPFPPELDDAAAAEEAVRPLEPNQPRSLAGVRGPGYRNYLWQTLNYGRGDTWEQGHVFLQLARHAGLDACVIGLPHAKPTPMLPRVAHPTLTPWAIGVLIGQQVYLLDPRLGLPLHHPETLAILTLAQAQENPAWLQWQGLTPDESTEADSVYPVRATDLRDMVALLDYPLEGFSLRCQFLQRNLTGANRIDLYFSPDDLADRFRQQPGIAEVQLWALPVEILMFRETIREATRRATRDRYVQAKLQWRTQEESYFDNFPLLRRSRVLFLLGRFQPDSSELVADCFREFQRMNYSDEDWRNIADNPELQKTLGLYQAAGQSAEEFRQALEGQKAAMALVRGDAKLYMALAHSEIQNHSTALNMLRHVSKYDLVAKWTRHTEYLKARSLESMKNYEAAITTYQEIARQFRSARSPRDYGNLLRVRILQQEMSNLPEESADP